MKKIFILLIFIFIAIFSIAQSPIFEWGKNIGSLSGDYGASISVDQIGNVYTTGYFAGTMDADPGSGTYYLASDSAATSDVFISKLDGAGNFIWAKRIGGKLNDNGNSIITDLMGNVYIVGFFSGTVDFDPNTGVFNLTSFGGKDVFILKLDNSGSFVWAKQMGGISHDYGYSIALDSYGNPYIMGTFFGTADFDPGIGTYYLTEDSTISDAGFISKLDTGGNFVWVQYFDLISDWGGSSITLDEQNNVYATGYYSGTVDFNYGPGIFDLTMVGNIDVYILKLDALGNFIWARSIGGNMNEDSYGITTDLSGNIYTTGYFTGTVDFDPGVGIFNLTDVNGWGSAFVSKLDSLGNFVWAKKIGGTSTIIGNSISTDLSGNIFITGFLQGTADFDPGSGVVNIGSAGSYDVFISKLDSLGNYIWAKNVGSTNGEKGFDITVDIFDNIYTTGYFFGTVDFDPGSGIFNLSSAGSADIFIQKFNQTYLGISATPITDVVSIYPNPTRSTFNIDISIQQKKPSIQIYNNMGELVYNQTASTQQTSIDLSNYSSGIYFVKVMSDDKIIGTQKIIKE